MVPGKHSKGMWFGRWEFLRLSGAAGRDYRVHASTCVAGGDLHEANLSYAWFPDVALAASRLDTLWFREAQLDYDELDRAEVPGVDVMREGFVSTNMIVELLTSADLLDVSSYETGLAQSNLGNVLLDGVDTKVLLIGAARNIPSSLAAPALS